MKQFKWVIILAAAAAVLTVIFIFVDKHDQKQKERNAIGGPQDLISFDSSKAERITIDNEDGHFEFKWSEENGQWVIASGEQFNVNTYAIAAICNYLSDLSSEKTVSFNCADTSVFGFDHPVTLKVYTTETGEDAPHTLYVGDHTPKNDAFYAMIEGSNDVFTIPYAAGEKFCVSKNTLKDMYLFNTYSNAVTYYKHTRDGKTVAELSRDSSNAWILNAPGSYTVQKATVDELMDIVVRATLNGYVAEHPSDLSQYGLDKPTDILQLKGKKNIGTMEEEIWFGSEASDLEVYGYFKNSGQVFRILKANTAFLKTPLSSYVYPYCIDVSTNELSKIDVDLGKAADLKFTLGIDSGAKQYSLNDTDITALHIDAADSLYQNLLRSVTMLRFTDTVPEASPDLSAEPAITMTFTYTDGHTRLLTFIEFETNNFYVIDDGKYTGLTIRMNRFEGTGSIPYNYEELMKVIKP